MSTKEKKDLVKREEAGAVGAPIDFAADAGGGFEDAGGFAYAIPMVKVLQSMSPQVKKSDGAYIKGAEEGDFYNTVTNEITKGDVGLLVIPCYYRGVFIEWQGGIDEGGGFVRLLGRDEGERLLATAHRDDKNNDRLPNGHILTDNREHYCLVIKEDGTTEPVLVSLTSTQIKKSKKWMSLMNNVRLDGMVTAPMFSQMYRITTVPETKDQFSWFGIKVEHVGPVKDIAAYRTAKDFRELVRLGQAKASYEEPAGDDETPF